MVGKQALIAASENQNKIISLKESIVIASRDYNAIIRKMKFLEDEKNRIVEPEEIKIDVDEIKDNVQRLCIDKEEKKDE